MAEAGPVASVAEEQVGSAVRLLPLRASMEAQDLPEVAAGAEEEAVSEEVLRQAEEAVPVVMAATVRL